MAGQPFGDLQKILSRAAGEAERLCDFALHAIKPQNYELTGKVIEFLGPAKAN